MASTGPVDALRQWIDRFVAFLVTKHGLAGILRADNAERDGRYDARKLVGLLIDGLRR